MEEGFDFVWRAFKRPYFQRQPGGKKVYMDVRDFVPYLKSWHENIATPARTKISETTSMESPTERSGQHAEEPEPQLCAKAMLESKDFSSASCLKLLKSITFASNRNDQPGFSADGGSPNHGERNITLGAFTHRGMKGITKRTFQRHDLTKYLIAFTIHHGSQKDFTTVSIVQGDNLKIKSDPNRHRSGKCSAGEFSGGELWIEDSSPEATHHVIDHDGAALTGRLLPVIAKQSFLTAAAGTRPCPGKATDGPSQSTIVLPMISLMTRRSSASSRQALVSKSRRRIFHPFQVFRLVT